jgi:hypothetical protein
MVLEAEIRTFTTGSFANNANLGKKKETKSAGLIPASNNDRHIKVKLYHNLTLNFM